MDYETETHAATASQIVPDPAMRRDAIQLTLAVVQRAKFERDGAEFVADDVASLYRRMLKLVISTTRDSGEWGKVSPPPGLTPEEEADWADAQV